MDKKVLNVAVIGCGGISRRHMEGVIEKEGANLYAVCDPDAGRMKKKQETYNVPIGVTDYRELVNDSNVDCALVLSPDPFHLEQTVAFLRAGKDVLLEKPMALKVEECEEMLRVEKETGRKLMVGQVARFQTLSVKVKQMIEEGAIGELTFVESEYAHDYSVARGHGDWRVNPEREGFIGGGCHAVDLLRWIAGNPTEVHAYSNHKYLLDWPVDDTTIAIYKFPNNVIGKVFCSIGVKRDYTMRTCLYGTKGTIIMDEGKTGITLYQCDAEGKGYTVPQPVDCEYISHNMKAEVSAFIDALLNDTPMPIDPMEGASTVAVCRATVAAAKSGETVKIRYPQI